jgi:hypothetical protein
LSPIEGPESRLVYTTDRREMPPVIHTHFIIKSLATAAHLGALGVLVEHIEGYRWRAPVSAKRDAIRYEQTFAALDAGRLRAQKQAARS